MEALKDPSDRRIEHLVRRSGTKLVLSFCKQSLNFVATITEHGVFCAEGTSAVDAKRAVTEALDVFDDLFNVTDD